MRTRASRRGRPPVLRSVRTRSSASPLASRSAALRSVRGRAGDLVEVVVEGVASAVLDQQAALHGVASVEQAERDTAPDARLGRVPDVRGLGEATDHGAAPSRMRTVQTPPPVPERRISKVTAASRATSPRSRNGSDSRIDCADVSVKRAEVRDVFLHRMVDPPARDRGDERLEGATPFGDGVERAGAFLDGGDPLVLGQLAQPRREHARRDAACAGAAPGIPSDRRADGGSAPASSGRRSGRAHGPPGRRPGPGAEPGADRGAAVVGTLGATT